MTAFKNRRHGLIWFPSMRGIAYLSVLRECLVLPSVIIVLENELSFVKGLAEEDKINGYSKKYFNINDSIESFAIEFNIPIIMTSAHSINDDSVVKELNKTALKYWLFTGGGVLKTKLFENERQFLHIHPGKLPEYRGSTCFYYSLLNNLSLCSSAFFLTPSLDKGTTLVSCDFSLNLTIDDNQQLFMDYILDPWIRAQTLKKVLMLSIPEPFLDPLSVEESTTINSNKVIDRTYYVMHPLLRALTINKVNQAFNVNQPTGVFLIE